MSQACDARKGGAEETAGESRKSPHAKTVFPEGDTTLLRSAPQAPDEHPDYALPATEPLRVAFHLNNEFALRYATAHSADMPHPPDPWEAAAAAPPAWQARRDTILERLAAHVQVPRWRRLFLLAVLFGVAGIAAIVIPFMAGDRLNAERVFTERVYTDPAETHAAPASAEPAAAPGTDVRPQIMEMLLREMAEDDAEIVPLAPPAPSVPPAQSPRPGSCTDAVRALALCDMQDAR